MCVNKVELDKAEKILLKYKDISYALLFGSFTKKPHPLSDIDILIDGRLSFSEKVNLASSLELIFKRKVDLVSVEEGPVGLVLKAFSSGYPILIRNKNKLKKDYFKYFYIYEDGMNLHRLKISRLKRRYSYG